MNLTTYFAIMGIAFAQEGYKCNPDDADIGGSFTDQGEIPEGGAADACYNNWSGSISADASTSDTYDLCLQHSVDSSDGSNFCQAFKATSNTGDIRIESTEEEGSTVTWTAWAWSDSVELADVGAEEEVVEEEEEEEEEDDEEEEEFSVRMTASAFVAATAALMAF